MKIVRGISIILIMIGFGLVWGSVGALENNNISELQCILQSLLGFSFLLPYVFVKLYQKHHDTI